MAYAVDYHNPFIIWTKPITVPGVKTGMYSVTSIGDVINNYTGKSFISSNILCTRRL